jgi:TonB family protein
MNKLFGLVPILILSACVRVKPDPSESRGSLSVPEVRFSVLNTSTGKAASPATQQAILESSRAQKGAMKKCYSSGMLLKGDSTTEGTVVTFFTIQTIGRVSAVAIESSTLGSPEVEACVMQTLWNARFRVSVENAPIRVTYPIQFPAGE